MSLHFIRRFTAVSLCTIFSLAGTADANPIQLSLTSTANDSLYGYIAGESYTFNWTVNSGFINNPPSSQFNSTLNHWGDNIVSEAPIFADISGDGLTGSWVRPILAEDDPYSFINIYYSYGSQDLSLRAFCENEDAPYSIGLTADGTDLVGLDAYGNIGNIFSFPGIYTDPNAYFTSYIGTYTQVSGGVRLVPLSGSALNFTATSITISQIPEPSSGVLIMFATGGLSFIRRRLRM